MMKIFISEAINPAEPHVDYIAARTRPEADTLAARVGNVRIVGELYTRLPCITSESLMAFIEESCAISVAWFPNAADQLAAFLEGKDHVEAEKED